MTYEEWEATVPDDIRADSLWKMTAYRLALYLSDLAWEDSAALMKERRTQSLALQLTEAIGSISPNIGEGYSRGTSRDRARFYEYALGSAREGRDCYFKGRHVLGMAVARERIALTTEIIRLLLIMVPQQRQRTLRETVKYEAAL